MSGMEGKRVVVTGGAGFVGSHLCDALIERKNDVLCVDNLVGTEGSTRNIDHLLRHSSFQFERTSVLDWALETDLRSVDCVFHQAASKNVVCMRDPEQDLLVNALATLRLLQVVHRDGVRKFVHASTGSVYGPALGRQDEKHPRNPVSYYGISKTAGESYCLAFGEIHNIDYTVLRYFHVIGPRQDDSEHGGVVPIFVRQCLEGRPPTIYGTGEQVRSFTSVHDIVHANIWAAETDAAAHECFNCASGIKVTIQDLADFVVAETKANVRIEYAPWRPGDVIRFDVDNSKIVSRGVRFETDWRKAVREVIAWKASQEQRFPCADARCAPP